MRFRLAITTGVSVLVAALAVATAAGTAAADTSGTAPQWGPMQSYSSVTFPSGSPPTTSITLPTAVACPAYGNCVAAGLVAAASGPPSPAVMLETGPGQWGPAATAPLPANAAVGGAAEFTSVACTSAGACVAVGSYATTANGTQALAVPFTVSGSSVSFGTPQQVALPGDAVTGGSQGAFLAGVSCASSGCTAVGTYLRAAGSVWIPMTATAGAGGAWAATAVAVPAAAANDTVLNAISCPATGACEAVGSYGDASSNLQLWAVQVAGGVAGAAQPVTIPGAASISANAPSPNNFLGLSTGLAAISCPSAGVCTAAGTVGASASIPEGVLLPITSGTPGTATTEAGAELEGISCSDSSHCTAAGMQLTGPSTAMAATTYQAGGGWSAPAQLPSTTTTTATPATLSLTIAEGVACTSPGVCVTTGIGISETGSGSSAIDSEGSFFAYSALPPTVTTGTLPAAQIGVPYSATLQSSGGTGTGSWAVTLGALPPGLTLNASTGVISGTPTTVGQNGFAVTATNAGPPVLSSATTSLSITVGPVASIALAYAKVSGRTALVVLSCSGAPCTGALKLVGIEHLKNGKPTAVVARAGKRVRKRTVTLASGRYSLTPAGSRVIVVRLNATGSRLLRQLGRISARLTLTPTGSRTPAVVKKMTFRSSRAG